MKNHCKEIFSMTLPHKARACALAAVTLALVACGGGGGGSGGGDSSSPGNTPTTTPPSSGSYAWLLKAQGSTNDLKYGLSLLHPNSPGTEWVIEPSSEVVSDAKLVSAGTINAAGLRASALKPYALLYIVGGDVRRVPMEANGASPGSRVQRAGTSSACAFEVDANDYASPENSRYVVTTAGADGKCKTNDDGRAELKLNAGRLTVNPFGGDAPLGAFRDATTLAPRGWIYPKTVSFWATDATVVTRTSSEPAFSELIASTYRAALLDDGAQLSVLDLPAGTVPTQNRLDAAITSGGGWCNIGFDANNFYVYRNKAGSEFQACGARPTAAATWTVLKISRTTPAATVMGTASGFISVASMGKTWLYATVIAASNNELIAINKASGIAQRKDTTPNTTLVTVQTSANDVHERWSITNIGTANVRYKVEMIDETGNILYATSSGGFPMAVADASSTDFNSSESRTYFVFADGYGARAFSGASVVGYDTSTKSTTNFGNLPGSADFGTDFVFASSRGGPGSFMTGFVARSLEGVIQPAGAKSFSFDANTSSSLKYVTVTQ
jgi:hypothetical protein